jgi:hypothetical protein
MEATYLSTMQQRIPDNSAYCPFCHCRRGWALCVDTEESLGHHVGILQLFVMSICPRTDLYGTRRKEEEKSYPAAKNVVCRILFKVVPRSRSPAGRCADSSRTRPPIHYVPATIHSYANAPIKISNDVCQHGQRPKAPGFSSRPTSARYDAGGCCWCDRDGIVWFKWACTAEMQKSALKTNIQVLCCHISHVWAEALTRSWSC